MVVRGGTAIIDCQADGFPCASCDVPGDYRAISSSSRIHVFENGSLAVHNADEKDAGFFLCQASNGISPVLSKVVKLSVHVAAHFKSKFKAESVQRGHIARLRCEAFGDKPVIITWSRDKQSFDPKEDPRYELNETVHGGGIVSEITIRGADRRDSALFTCLARNAYGIRRHEHATDPPRIMAPQVVERNRARFGNDSRDSRPTSCHTPPRKDLQFGPLKGYYVGYKVKDTTDTYVYKTLELTPANLHDECHITNLKRNTDYSVVVQAFNAKGAGPPSEEIFVKTLKNDPPTSPAVKVQSSTSSSISVSWKGSDTNDVLGYVLHVRKDLGEWNKINVPRDAAEYTVDQLTCGASYQLYLSAFNSVGNGGPSNIISAKTIGVAPVAPDKPSLITINSTSIAIHLDSWHDGGCPFIAFEVRFRRQKDKVWNVVGHNIPPQQKQILLNDLIPGVPYLLQVIAKNEAGITEAEYDFVTLPAAQAPATPSLVVENEATPFYLELGVILPACISLIVVLVVGVLVYIVLRKRYSSDSSNSGSSAYGSRKGTHLQECLHLSEVDPSLGKKTMSLDGRLDYYPTPLRHHPRHRH
ncbi:hypothetical protein MTO96_002494 [Rhipicephalus appendiculatus]